nr:Rho binding incomplete domain containing protein [Pandoravirus aubagnensis]
MDIDLKPLAPSLHATIAPNHTSVDARDSSRVTHVKVVLLSQKGEQAHTAVSAITVDNGEPTNSTLRFCENISFVMGDDTDAKSHPWQCTTTPFLEWHSAPLPAWLPLPGSIAAAAAASGVSRDSVTMAVFQKEAAVVASESDLFVGTLPHPLDGRVYTWPVVLGMCGASTHGSVWLDMDAATCDAMLSAWLAGDIGAPARVANRCETDIDSSALSTDDEAAGGDGCLVPTTTTTDDECDGGASRPKRGGRTGATAGKRRRCLSSDKSGNAVGTSRGRRSVDGRDSQPNTTDDDDDVVARAPHHRSRAAGRMRRRSTAASDDDSIMARVDDLDIDDDDNADDHSNNATPTTRGPSDARRRRKSKTGGDSGSNAHNQRVRDDHANSRRYARSDAFEEDSDGDACAPEDDDDEPGEYDRCDDEIDVGDRDDDPNNGEDDEDIDDEDMDGDDDAADDTADCDVDDDLADDEDDLMDEDPNAE